jgi:hypothetical protein
MYSGKIAVPPGGGGLEKEKYFKKSILSGFYNKNVFK